MVTAQNALLCPRAVVFDLMGTCLDWHTAVTPTLEQALSRSDHGNISRPGATDKEVSDLALAWRQAFFDGIHKRFEAGEPPEDIDTTHRRTLVDLLGSERWSQFGKVGSEDIDMCVRAWHKQLGKRCKYCCLLRQY